MEALRSGTSPRTQEAPAAREALAVDCVTVCPPMGVMYAAMGLHRCIPLTHGSTGCARLAKNSFYRSFHVHTKAVSTHLKENEAIYGGEGKFLEGVQNVQKYYAPELIAAHTTCMTETIGENLEAMKTQVRLPESCRLFTLSAGGYHGSHLDGFSSLLCAAVTQLTERSEQPLHRAALLPGMLNPGDVREIKRIARAFEMAFTTFPDVSEAFSAPFPQKAKDFPDGGTTYGEIRALGACDSVFYCGDKASGAAAQAIADKGHASVIKQLPVPIGLSATDAMVQAFCAYTGREMPNELREERSALVHFIMRCHTDFCGKKAVVYTDSDLAVPVAAFLSDIGIEPVLVYTTNACKGFRERAAFALGRFGITPKMRCSADLLTLKEDAGETDFYIGDSHLAYLARETGKPCITLGFPQFDGYSHTFLPITGYRGAMRLVERLTECFPPNKAVFRR